MEAPKYVAEMNEETTAMIVKTENFENLEESSSDEKNKGSSSSEMTSTVEDFNSVEVSSEDVESVVSASEDAAYSAQRKLSCEPNSPVIGKNVYLADGTINVHKNTKSKSRQCLKACEGFFLPLAVLIIIGLFTIPTVYYALPPTQPLPPVDITCKQVEPYSGQVCVEQLSLLHSCFSGASFTPPLTIPSTDHQEKERNAKRLLDGLKLLSSPHQQQCSREVQPFLCLFVFGLCDSAGKFHNITRGDCIRFKDGICATEWTKATRLFPGILPDCEDLPDTDTTDNCTGTPAHQPANDVTSGSLITPPSIEASPTDCSEGFYLDHNGTGLCRPECGKFRYTDFATVFMELGSIYVGLFTGIALWVLALTVHKKSLLVFPTVLLVYPSGTLSVLAIVVIVGSFDNVGLFCKSHDQVYSVGPGNQTGYCTFSGIVAQYCLVQVCVWAVLHAWFLAWAVKFPWSYRQLRISGRIRLAHIISVLLAVILPLPSALVPLKDGYLTTNNPTFACAGRNTDITYYTFILPLSIILGMTSSLLMLILWEIFKEFVVKKIADGKKVGKVGVTEIKMVLIVAYYIITGVMGLVAYTYHEVKTISNREGLEELIICESTGKKKCVVNLITIDHIRTLSVVAIVLLSSLPIVAILFTCNCKMCTKKKSEKNKLRNGRDHM